MKEPWEPRPEVTITPLIHSLLALALCTSFTACGGDVAEPRVVTPDPPSAPQGNFTFSYAPPGTAPTITAISVRGTFNGWESAAMERQADGTWTRLAQLPDGNTEYKFFVNGAWVQDMCYDETWGDPAHGYVVDPDAQGCTSDGYEGQNAVVAVGSVPLDFRHSASDPVDVSAAGGRLSIRFRARAGQVRSARVISGSDTVSAALQLTSGILATWRASVARTTGSYTIAAETADSVATFGPFQVPGTVFESVPWVEDAVGYQIFPERFWNGDPSNDSLALATDEYGFMDPAFRGPPPVITPEWNGPVAENHCCHQYFGGDLQGIVDRMDDLVARGVNVLYLNPVFTAGSAHGYDTYDYLQVAPHLGDTTTLRTLLDRAHQEGMHVIWDFVPNHVGVGHWAFQDAVAKGQASDTWDWFHFKVPADSIQVGDGSDYDAWWGYGSLPELQTDNPRVMSYLLDVATHWTAFGFDGIRVDVPGDIGNRSVFFPAWRKAVKAASPEEYLVGEIWERDPSWLRGDQFDALMNYALGLGAVVPFAKGDMAGPKAAREIAAEYGAYPEASVAMSFNLVSSHDTDRLLTMMGGGELGQTASPESRARHKLAAAVLFALPGMPVTFQGDECAFLGESGGRQTARYPIQWDRCDPTFVAYYASLAALKRTTPALGTPVFRAYPDAATLLAFYRGEPGEGEVLAAFNNTTGTRTMRLPDGSWVDLATGETFSGQVSVEGLGWRYLRRG